MRCIDADALIEFIDNRYDITWADDYEGGIKDACTDILGKINAMSTIEPERKKGRWIENNPHKWGLGIVFECSECGEKIDCEPTNYCPNCGASMTGDKE